MSSFSLKSLFPVLITLAVFGSSSLTGVYSQGINKVSPLIRSWGTQCVVVRGYVNLSDTTATANDSNRASVGEESDAAGEADGTVISLGDGGMATYILENPLRDIAGPDLAVFENGFRSQAAPRLWYLELAFVEVSSDGERFVRFPAVSETQTSTQVGAFDQLDTAAIHNLAGENPALYGTPFDLQDLKDSTGIDLQHITHIRIIDVVGSINPRFGSRDFTGNLINDPFPTPFGSGGFDLDALAILGESTGNRRFESGGMGLEVFPNPVRSNELFQVSIGLAESNYAKLIISDYHGVIIFDQDIFPSIAETSYRFGYKQSQIPNNQSAILNLSSSILSPGLYLITLTLPAGRITKKLVVL